MHFVRDKARERDKMKYLISQLNHYGLGRFEKKEG